MLSTNNDNCINMRINEITLPITLFALNETLNIIVNAEHIFFKYSYSYWQYEIFFRVGRDL